MADIAWTRDPVGNPLTETRTGTNPATKTFTYDNIDRLTGRLLPGRLLEPSRV